MFRTAKWCYILFLLQVIPPMFRTAKWCYNCVFYGDQYLFDMATTPEIYYMTGWALGYMMVDTLCMVSS